MISELENHEIIDHCGGSGMMTDAEAQRMREVVTLSEWSDHSIKDIPESEWLRMLTEACSGPVRYAVVREDEVTCERKQIGQVETSGDPYEDFHKRFGSCVDYTPMETTDDESPEDYRYRIGVAE